uniref:Uncharacterized protein n=1 Tax=Glossina pallidipes TaxID=7398 RepID=A0A1B0A1Y1_GLOPL
MPEKKIRSLIASTRIVTGLSKDHPEDQNLGIEKQIILDENVLCPHNKIAGKIQKIYREEKPIRLNDVSHLRMIGQCECNVCGAGRGNKLLCTCQWQKKHRSPSGQKKKDDKDGSIFRLKTSQTEDTERHDKKMLPLRSKGGCLPINWGRNTLFERFRQSYKKSKNYLSGRKSNESFDWIMKPVENLRESSDDMARRDPKVRSPLQNLPKVKQTKTKSLETDCTGYTCPVDQFSSASVVQQIRQGLRNKRRSEVPYSEEIETDYDLFTENENQNQNDSETVTSIQTLKLKNGKNYIRPVGRNYPKEMMAGRSEISITNQFAIIENARKERTKLKSEKKTKTSHTAIEFYNKDAGLEDMQHKPSKEVSLPMSFLKSKGDKFNAVRKGPADDETVVDFELKKSKGSVTSVLVLPAADVKCKITSRTRGGQETENSPKYQVPGKLNDKFSLIHQLNDEWASLQTFNSVKKQPFKRQRDAMSLKQSCTSPATFQSSNELKKLLENLNKDNAVDIIGRPESPYGENNNFPIRYYEPIKMDVDGLKSFAPKRPTTRRQSVLKFPLKKL